MRRNGSHNFSSNEAGASILEVLIAGVIGIVVAFAVARASINANSAEKESELELAQAAMMNRIENAIDDPVLCPGLWQTWNGAAFVKTAFDPTGGSPVAYVDLIQDGAPTDIARSSNLAGANTVGLTFPPDTPTANVSRMQFKEPVQISENTYDWTLLITVVKVPSNGQTLSGPLTTLRRLRLEVTTNGSAGGYQAIYCGPPTSPEANQQIPPVRFTSVNVPCYSAPDATDTAVKDGQCQTEFGPTYIASGLHELVAYRMVFAATGGGNGGTGAFPFAVVNNQHKFSNSNDGTNIRAPGTVYDAGTGGNCSVACVRNTAPMRFTRVFFPPGTANKTAVCQEYVGANYVAAHPNDLIRYGFRNGNTVLTAIFDYNVGSFATSAVFDGGSFACEMAWSTNVSGPILDCNPALTAYPFPLACVLK